jgi:hypothetical protein
MAKIYEELKGIGFESNTSVILDDVDEETKHMILCEHSEKIGVVLALMKNLRVCEDCHNFNNISNA